MAHWLGICIFYMFNLYHISRMCLRIKCLLLKIQLCYWSRAVKDAKGSLFTFLSKFVCAKGHLHPPVLSCLLKWPMSTYIFLHIPSTFNILLIYNHTFFVCLDCSQFSLNARNSTAIEQNFCIGHSCHELCQQHFTALVWHIGYTLILHQSLTVAVWSPFKMVIIWYCMEQPLHLEELQEDLRKRYNSKPYLVCEEHVVVKFGLPADRGAKAINFLPLSRWNRPVPMACLRWPSW